LQSKGRKNVGSERTVRLGSARTERKKEKGDPIRKETPKKKGVVPLSCILKEPASCTSIKQLTGLERNHLIIRKTGKEDIFGTQEDPRSAITKRRVRESRFGLKFKKIRWLICNAQKKKRGGTSIMFCRNQKEGNRWEEGNGKIDGHRYALKPTLLCRHVHPLSSQGQSGRGHPRG